MKIALLGGTGDMGAALAFRWGKDTDHDLLVGSRDPERARKRAADYEQRLADRGFAATVRGHDNATAAGRADVAVLGVPPYYARSTVEEIGGDLGDAVLVSPVVGLDRDEAGFHYDPPKTGSLTELVADSVPDGVPVVGAFHNVPAGRLADPDAELGFDVAVVGDEAEAKKTVRTLVDAVDGIRPVDAGGLANAAEIEALTAALLNVREFSGQEQVGVCFR